MLATMVTLRAEPINACHLALIDHYFMQQLSICLARAIMEWCQTTLCGVENVAFPLLFEFGMWR